MGSRFVEGTQEAIDLMNQVREEHFPMLTAANIKILFDTKIRSKGGRMVLGRILKANDLIRRLTDNMAEEGCDYIMFLDEVVFENIETDDKIRLIRHELRHCRVLGTEEKPKYKVIPHDIEDFVIEIELNKDKIDWAKRAAELAENIYAQMGDEKKDEQNQTPETGNRRRRKNK